MKEWRRAGRRSRWAGAAGDRPEGRLLTPGVLAASLALAALTAVFLGTLIGMVMGFSRTAREGLYPLLVG